jgi:hypothetical protein
MFMQKFRFRINVLVLMGLVSGVIGIPAPSLFATEARPDEERYQAMLVEHQQRDDKRKAVELIASGTAAALVGIYGYHFDNRGVLAAIAYAGTQTAGILVIGEGIRRYYSTSVVTAIDGALSESDVSKEALKRTLLDNDDRLKQAKLRADAWTAGLLGGIYMYNAIQVPNDLKNGRNVFLFLSVNALAVSSYSTYKIYKSDYGSQVGFKMTGSGPTFFANF